MTEGDGQRAAVRAVREWAADAGVELLPGARPGELVVELPGERRLRTAVSLLAGHRTLGVSAFVVRRPDEHHAEFYARLLTRNARLPGVAFALDRLGDVYLVGRLPLAAVTPRAVDDLLGVVLSAADGMFDELLGIGFESAIRREWAWRLDRGEPTRNLAAFEHLRPDR